MAGGSSILKFIFSFSSWSKALKFFWGSWLALLLVVELSSFVIVAYFLFLMKLKAFLSFFSCTFYY